MLSPMATTKTTTTMPYNNIILECGILWRRAQEVVALEGGMLHRCACQCCLVKYATEVPRLCIYLEADIQALGLIKLGNLAGTNTTVAVTVLQREQHCHPKAYRTLLTQGHTVTYDG